MSIENSVRTLVYSEVYSKVGPWATVDIYFLENAALKEAPDRVYSFIL